MSISLGYYGRCGLSEDVVHIAQPLIAGHCKHHEACVVSVIDELPWQQNQVVGSTASQV